MNSRFCIILLAVLLLSVTGCSRRFHLTEEQMAVESVWPFHRGALRGQGFSEGAGFNGELNVIWERGSSEKPAGPLTLSHGVLIVPGSKRKIRFYDAMGGDYLGHWQAKRAAQTGLALVDSLAYFGTAPPVERLDCIDLTRRDRIWRRRLKDAAAGTIILNDRLIAASSDGLLRAYNAYNGDLLWSLKVEGRLVAGPTSDGDRIYQPVANGILLAVAAKDGRELFRVDLAQPLAASVAIADLVYVTSVHGDLFAVSPDDGHVVWQVSLGGEAWTAPAVAEGRLFVGLSSGALVALDAQTGQELWRHVTVEVVKASATVVGKFVVVGTMGGNLFCLNVADGTITAQRQLKGAVAVPPISDGSRILVATEQGEIACFGEAHEEVSRLDQQIDTGSRYERSGPFPGTGVGHGRTQGFYLRYPSPDGPQSAGKTVSRLRTNLSL
ncbi:MAG: PQQ-binding-like beta-propeller repeat protein [candidate division Zixibacteria bacterium]|nr:PQQ-binding-like beta-propeller repeat protein [candidate division Zixibacteria bacterium]MDH3936348.1 PQQ-binding-like beta-propeller repeat protein [candidate division Zixibacteria bacterium]MDH4035219.1 PQQ-binding-like beta-propeller repeat protein [candidate division Zixibacteria bacterium]